MQLTHKKMFLFWLPLMATWLLMAVCGQWVTGVVARLPEAVENLAALGVAMAFALVLEAPVIMLTNAASALVRGPETYRQVRSQTFQLNALVTAATLVALLPPVFGFLTGNLMGLDPALAQRAHRALFWLLPWPAAIGFRRFYQGVVVQSGKTRQITAAALVRAGATAATCWWLGRYSGLEGASVGAAALSAGVTGEGLAVRWLARGPIASVARRPAGGVTLTRRRFWTFYYPLLLTAFISMGVEPLVTFFVGHARAPIESLAVLPLINVFVFGFCSFSLALQDTMVALLGSEPGARGMLRSFALRVGGVMLFALTVLAYTPLLPLWLTTIGGLPAELAAFTVLPLRVAAPIPLLSMVLSYYVAVAIHEHRTMEVTIATALEGFIVGAGIWYGIHAWNQTGALTAAAALTLGRLAGAIYLSVRRLIAARSLTIVRNDRYRPGNY